MDRFELEQALLECWHTGDDIKVIVDAMRQDNAKTEDIIKALDGLALLHSMRHDKAFQIFEHLIITGDIK